MIYYVQTFSREKKRKKYGKVDFKEKYRWLTYD